VEASEDLIELQFPLYALEPWVGEPIDEAAQIWNLKSEI
jgi:hypothetical protein